MPTRTILIADPDPSSARVLGPALRERGYQVSVAADGSRALELAILRTPDLVLLDEEAPLVDARSFVRILKANPRTERIPVILLGTAVDTARSRRGEYVRKPFDVGDVLNRVDQVFRRAAAARAVSSDAGFEGSLLEIPLADLVQMLGMNRKTGRLTIKGSAWRGEIAFAEGRVVDAALGSVVGEKALYRLIPQREGRFAFAPGDPGTSSRIAKQAEVVLEGARQADELAQLRPSAPAATDLVALATPASAVPEGLHPAAAEVVALLATPRTVQDVLDRTTASDVDVLRALGALLERGHARRDSRLVSSAGRAAQLLGEDALHGSRRRLSRGSDRAPTAGVVILAGGGPLARRAALRRFATLPGFGVEAEGAQVDFGTVGRLALGEAVQLDLVALPSDPALEPLWRPFTVGAVAALVLAPADGAAERLAPLARAMRLPVGLCGPTGADTPDVAHADGWLSLHGDPAEALRALVAAAAAHASRG